MSKRKKEQIQGQYIKIGLCFLLLLFTIFIYLGVDTSPSINPVHFEPLPTSDYEILKKILPEETAAVMQEEFKKYDLEVAEGIEQLQQEIIETKQRNKTALLFAIIIAFGFMTFSILELIKIVRTSDRKKIQESGTITSMIKEVLNILLIPRYTELALFSMSLTFLLLFFTNPTSQSDVERFYVDQPGLNNPAGYSILALFSLGMFYSIYHAFIRKPKTNFQKRAMLYFAIFVNVFSGLTAGSQMMQDAQGILIVFPLWNLANAILLLSLYKSNKINIDNIQDDEVTPPQLIFGSLIVVTLFAFCQYFLGWHWATVFSVCVIYATNLNFAVKLLLSWQQSEVA